MDQDTKAELGHKFLQNILGSGFIFMLWMHFLPWQLYFAMGLIVALVLISEQWKDISNKLLYTIVFVSDMIFWPTMIYLSVKNSFNEN